MHKTDSRNTSWPLKVSGNSPKQMATYLKVQENFHSANIRLTAKGRRKLTKFKKKKQLNQDGLVLMKLYHP